MDYPPNWPITRNGKDGDMEIWFPHRTGRGKYWILKAFDENGKSPFWSKQKIKVDSKDFSPVISGE